MKIEIICLDKKIAKFNKKTTQYARLLERVLRLPGEIEVFLIDAKRMKRLNRQFLKKNQSTNVLSFLKPKNFPGTKLGEVYLDPIYIAAHKEDLGYMLIHGILHVLGYDHVRKGDRIKMENKERKLLGGFNPAR